MKAATPAVRLTGWKSIAAHVGHDERTVKRWEETRGLPVHRLPGARRSIVFAYVGELAAWRDGPTDLAIVPPPAATAVPGQNPLLAVALGLAAVATMLLLLAGQGRSGQRPTPSRQPDRTRTDRHG